jgi:hypothetical protein
MKVLFAGQVPKEPAFPDDIEDFLEIADDGNKIVISDGASESYDSKTWAQILTSSLMRSTELSPGWLAEVISEYVSRFDLANLSWSKQAAFARGSFATLLVVEQCADNDILKVTSIGDSLAVLLDGESFIESFPYVKAEDFRQRPELVCTNSLSNESITTEDFPTRYQKNWTRQERTNPIILCMTDALGEWALHNWEAGELGWHQLIQIREMAELEALVIQEREAKTLRVDDTTLVCISLIDSETVKDELPES